MIKEVFKTGKWTSSSGKTREWTKSDIDKMVSSFTPDTQKVPMTAGHPAGDSPAWGWVKKVWRDGKSLFAEFGDIVKEMGTAIEKGMFSETSISVNSDGSLRHIAMLGGAPPAVPGLGALKFADNNYDNLSNFEEPTNLNQRNNDMTPLETQLTEKNAVLEAKVTEQKDALETANHAAKEAETVQTETTEKLEKAEKEVTDLKEEYAKKEKDAVIKADSDFVDGLVKNGNLLDSKSEITKTILGSLSIEKAEFSEGDKKVTISPKDKFKAELNADEVNVPGSDFAKKGDGHPDNDDDAVTVKVKEKMEKNPKLDMSKALTEVLIENPELNKGV